MRNLRYGDGFRIKGFYNKSYKYGIRELQLQWGYVLVKKIKTFSGDMQSDATPMKIETQENKDGSFVVSFLSFE